MPGEAAPSIPADYELRELRADDGRRLLRFYHSLTRDSQRKLTPLGVTIDRQTCERICQSSAFPDSEKHNVILLAEGRIIAWCFVWGIGGPQPALGLAVEEAHQRRGLGRAMLLNMLKWVAARRIPSVHLTVAPDNVAARRLYASAGFRLVGQAPAGAGGAMHMRYDLQLPLNEMQDE